MQGFIHILRFFTRSSRVTACLSPALVFILAFVLLVVPPQASAQTGSLSFNLKNVTLETALKKIEEKSGYHFIYSHERINADQKVDLNIQNASISEVLAQLLGSRNIEYEMKEYGYQIVLTPKPVRADPSRAREITGRVVSIEGSVLPGAHIRSKETQRSAIADITGGFLLQLTPGDKTLVVSYIGMQTQEIVIQDKNHFSITLQPEEEAMEEVAVTGYQTLSKKRTTGSYAVVDPVTLKGKMQTDIVSRLEGQVAGMVQQGKNLSIRGISTIRGDKRPLVVVDGMPFEGEINSINPSIITNITVLKDAAAASIYGAKAANGVLVITTKKGATDGQTWVSYDGSVRFQPIPDFSYLNLLNSRELVDIQKAGFKYKRGTYEQLNKRVALNPVEELLYKHRSNLITDAELEEGLEKYRNLENMEQLKDFFLRKGIRHQHNLSLSGGNEKNRYVASVSYTGNNDIARYAHSEQIGITLRDDMKFFKWLRGNIDFAANLAKSGGDAGMGTYSAFYRGSPSYTMLRDAEGNPLHIPSQKSDYELKRLRSIGLMDETYSPITNRTERSVLNKANYTRLQLGLNFLLLKGLNLDVKYQTERTFTNERELYSKNDYYVRNMINDAAQYDSDTKVLTLNIPEGGQIKEFRGEQNAYTLRTQLNYALETGKHSLTALAGAERRVVKRTGTGVYQVGYDDNTLSFKLVDLQKLGYITGTEAIYGTFFGFFGGDNYFSFNEDRFVSFYANSAYTFNQKYELSGSIRMDQSNLFGTDPKLQYRPLWSLGAAWYMDREDFMQNLTWLDRLNLRATYGIGGNVPKDAGPFLTLGAPRNNFWLGEFGSTIANPPNPMLRWEKTATTNFGMDFSVLQGRFGGSIDYYNKYTTDLLAYRNSDPTLGWDQLLINYGSMVNKGLEISLNSRNIQTDNFKWTTALTFAINKSKLLDVDDSRMTITNYSGGNTAAKGYPMSSVFSYRYAKIDTLGKPHYYTATGDTTLIQITNIGDLVFSGTTIPVRSGSFTNTFSYKNFDLMLMFVYYGGHVLRADVAPYLATPPSRNLNRQLLNMWQVKGDELKENVTPGYAQVSMDVNHQWYAADKHVVDASYIKLRDVALTYNLGQKWLRKCRMQSMALMLQVQNLWTWTANKRGIDPEAMSIINNGWGERILPIPVVWTIGASVNF